MELSKLKEIEKGIIMMQNLIKHMPRNYSQVIKLQAELTELINKYQDECKNHPEHDQIDFERQ